MFNDYTVDAQEDSLMFKSNKPISKKYQIKMSVSRERSGEGGPVVVEKSAVEKMLV